MWWTFKIIPDSGFFSLSLFYLKENGDRGKKSSHEVFFLLFFSLFISATMTYDLAIRLAGRLVAGKLIVANMAKHYCPALYYLI